MVIFCWREIQETKLYIKHALDARLRKNLEAFLMGTHARCGAGSPVMLLRPIIIRMIYEQMRKPETCKTTMGEALGALEEMIEHYKPALQ